MPMQGSSLDRTIQYIDAQRAATNNTSTTTASLRPNLLQGQASDVIFIVDAGAGKHLVQGQRLAVVDKNLSTGQHERRLS